MRRLGWVVAMLIGAAGQVAAQRGAAMTPDGCIKSASDWFNQAYKAARDSAALPGGKPADVRALLAERNDRLAECAGQFHLETMRGPVLLQLAALYSQVGKDSLAVASADKRIREPGISPADSAEALTAMIAALTRPDTLAIEQAEPYMDRLDRMSNAVVMQKIAAHARLDGEYRYLDVDSRIRQHSRAIIALARPIKLGALADRRPDVLNPFTVLIAYTDLAEVYGDMGEIDSAMTVLAQARRDHPEVADSDAERLLGPERERYQLVGSPAPAIAADHWLNAPAGTHVFDREGQVTVVEFTAHWCIPCRNSYPSMVDMAHRFGPQGVRFVFATQFYGYLGNSGPLDPAGEFAADREYYDGEHGISFPVAVADQPVHKAPSDPYLPNPNDAAYKVGGIPQTVVIDRAGVIRRILTGWDTGNAQRLPVLLGALLQEPGSRQPQ